MMRTSTPPAFSSRSAISRPTSPPPMIVTFWRPRRRAGRTRAATSRIASGVPMMMILSPAASCVVPRGTNSCAAALHRDDQRAARQVQLTERRRRPVRTQLRAGTRAAESTPPANTSASIAPGRGDHLFDVGGQLRLGPQHAVDAELFEAAPAMRRENRRATRGRWSRDCQSCWQSRRRRC